MHLAGSGRVIVQLSKELVEGQILCDKKGTRVAKVMELIGPVNSPFYSSVSLDFYKIYEDRLHATTYLNY